MKEGIGNTVVISLVMVFIVFMSSYLAFTINYSKAFKMKSKLIDVIQSHNNNMNDEEIAVEMNNYINEIGYSTNSETMQSNCTNAGYSVMEGATGWCYKEFSSEVNDEGNVELGYSYECSRENQSAIVGFNVESPKDYTHTHIQTVRTNK